MPEGHDKTCCDPVFCAVSWMVSSPEGPCICTCSAESDNSGYMPPPLYMTWKPFLQVYLVMMCFGGLYAL